MKPKIIFANCTCFLLLPFLLFFVFFPKSFLLSFTFLQFLIGKNLLFPKNLSPSSSLLSSQVLYCLFFPLSVSFFQSSCNLCAAKVSVKQTLKKRSDCADVASIDNCQIRFRSLSHSHYSFEHPSLVKKTVCCRFKRLQQRKLQSQLADSFHSLVILYILFLFPTSFFAGN